MKNILVISQHGPFDDQHMRESLDTTLIFAAIEQNISWLLSGDAVLALKKHQKPEVLGIKNYFKTIKTLELYDVENIYVCEKSLMDFNLTKDNLIIDVKVANFEQQRLLISQQHQVVTL
ncbi:sulfurtransferase complex subunit TusC [Pseudoalteromonas lipolytica]|uniref:Sulfurtransferase complex subunit TusC n=1 Tax=Pseudoalteromonas lipolytica TaxID=570156 RepID=A0AAD0S003_9GAMM|nr:MULTISPECIES: sulfurtransferase complex subunit TusC [Pseudoalteromonas]AXV65113.1 sulfurtransferase complex subunit TusC [Pseudoalteromonas donghaensis]MBE0351051.1 tRNA 2-thiouridine synthesizing protein C [Pseudoalteromonas lipolytica LMEB 39]QLJ09618.1 sulfurtransferase complex subunit TusC [Pseudoalteromonas sp. JSTW]SFT33736.1 tRNA 2-thiouridine synthesizing protein C [Pseudoalteromonas lipolytica]